MTSLVDFDALARTASTSNGAMPALNALFGHTFALPQWHFIARGQLPDVHPYIASNAAYANGAHMVRAFTDTNRLLRFAKENNLTTPDGGASILSMPTATIIDYLEKLVAQGAQGIWFNSDSESEGFFAPLQQLRPMKTHLEKIGWKPAAGA